MTGKSRVLRRGTWQFVFAAIVLLSPVHAQSASQKRPTAVDRDIDPALAHVIDRIQAIDNHAHPVLPSPHGSSDRDFDALPVEDMAPQTDPVAWRTDNPQLLQAWSALWGFNTSLPLTPATTAQLDTARAAIKSREKQHYAAWVLHQSGIATMLSNRVSMGPGVEPPQFLWVPYADALLFPLDNTTLAAANPDRRQFFPLEDRLRNRYLQAAGIDALPLTLTGYLTRVVIPTLERHKTEGAVAEKFELAYLRPFDLGNPSQAEAETIYARWVGKPSPDTADYKLLQDFLFRYIARECGRLGMPVHLHAMSGGGSYFNIAGSNPLLLEPLLDDPQLRHTSFVLLHGGWPFVREAGALLQKPNVFLDLSQEALTFPPRTLAGWLREWLETYPNKVLFGTDGYPFSPSMGWEEATWIASRNERDALGLALTGMLRDGEISPARARDIATQVLRGSAASLYARPPRSQGHSPPADLLSSPPNP